MHILPMVVALFQFTTTSVQFDSTAPRQLVDAWQHRSEHAELCLTGHRVSRHGEPGRIVVTRFTPVAASDTACTEDPYIGAVYLTTADSSYQEVMFTYGQVTLELHRQWYLVLFVFGVAEDGLPRVVLVSY